MDKIFINNSKEYFEHDKSLKEVYVTEDNQIFYTNAKNFLDDYVKEHDKKGVKIKWELVKRSDVFPVQKTEPKKAQPKTQPVKK